jgi:uncharacterized protein (DUF2141 family)
MKKILLVISLFLIAFFNFPLPVLAQSCLTGDVDGDGKVNIVDIGIILDAYGTTPPSDTRADLNQDNKVNMIDLGIVIDNYGI